MTETQPPTMTDLYPDGRGYHKAHEGYMRAVAAAFTASGLTPLDWHADANDPRDGAIQLDPDDFGHRHDEVWVCWQEERRWSVLTVDKRDSGEDSRFVYDLDAGTVFSPESVVRSFAERMGVHLAQDPPADDYPDVDFPDHTFDEDNVALELALRRYAA